MVQLQDPIKGKLTFNKLDDPDDTAFVKAYKHMFRYAMPNLFMWGPLAPAHDALMPRATMACIQLGVGAAVLYGTFRRYSPSMSAFRRRFTRITCLLTGSALTIAGLKELAYDLDPNSNPLYIEIHLAREFGPERTQKPTFSSYWNGPKNFFPMNNKQFWKMIYTLDLNQVMVDQYEETDLMGKYEDLIARYSEEAEPIDDNLTGRIRDAVNSTSKSKLSDFKGEQSPSYKLFNVSNDKQLKSKTLATWFKQHPLDELQFSEHQDYLDYEFPRMKLEAEKEKKQ